MTDEDKRRLEEDILRVILEGIPQDNKVLVAYEKGIICPMEAARQLLWEYYGYNV